MTDDTSCRCLYFPCEHTELTVAWQAGRDAERADVVACLRRMLDRYSTRGDQYDTDVLLGGLIGIVENGLHFGASQKNDCQEHIEKAMDGSCFGCARESQKEPSK